MVTSQFRADGEIDKAVRAFRGGAAMMRVGSGRRASLRHRGHTHTRSALVPRGPASASPTRTAVESSTADDLELTRLLSIARLTPTQAVALGADVLGGLEERDPSARPQLRPGAVRIGRDGRARLIAGDPTSVNGAVGASAAALLDKLREAARPSPAAHDLISALEGAATAVRPPRERLAIAAAILREADAAGGVQARVELARLVAIATGGV